VARKADEKLDRRQRENAGKTDGSHRAESSTRWLFFLLIKQARQREGRGTGNARRQSVEQGHVEADISLSGAIVAWSLQRKGKQGGLKKEKEKSEDEQSQ
jgi:hypothetical protein